MTNERRAEIEAIHAQKMAAGVKVAEHVTAMIRDYQSKLDPSEYWELLFQLGQRIEELEPQANDLAQEHEKATYGVSLEDIDGDWDKPIEARDMRTPPSGFSV